MSKGALRPKEAGQVLLHGADAGDTKGVHQQLGHAGAEESGKGGAQVDVLHPQGEQGQEHNDRLLLIPSDVVDNGQVVEVRQTEDLLQLQGDEGQGVGIIALAGVQNPRNAANVAQVQLVVFVLGAAVMPTASKSRVPLLDGVTS